ncbi:MONOOXYGENASE [Ceraceosorus bombacis]|uniref:MONOOXYGENASE n=1 Tax=Ceraceosorus bombacis TaxID=401625 RepID=A0A0N7L9L6_9BASI|nr:MONOOXYGENASE [Ceraceosorus bombacis]
MTKGTGQERPLDIVILGGGIAGLATAVALRQRTPHHVTVLERAALQDCSDHSRRLEDDGAASSETQHLDTDYGIALAPNGAYILGMLGMKDHAQELRGIQLDYWALRPASDEEVPPSQFPTDPAAPAIFCSRGALIRWLIKAATDESLPGTPVTIESGLGSLEIDIQSAKAGSKSGDLLILADGLTKTGRAAVLADQGLPPEHWEDAYITAPQVAYMGLLPVSALSKHSHLLMDSKLQLQPNGTLMNWTWDPVDEEGNVEEDPMRRAAKQQRLILYPISKEHVQLFAYLPSTPELLARFQRGTRGGCAAFIRNVCSEEAAHHFAAFAPNVRELLTACPKLDLAQIRDAPTLASWHSNDARVVIIGDAAHAALPHTGQGSSQALEDADALSHLLSPLRSATSTSPEESEIFVPQLAAALKTFDSVTLPRAHLTQRIARLFNGCIDPAELQQMDCFDFEEYNARVMSYRGVEAHLAQNAA